MTNPDELHHTSDAQLDADLDPTEREAAAQLVSARAVPAAEFRGALGRHLVARDPGYGPRPERLRPLVSLYLGAGAALLGLGALLATGVL